MSGPLIDPGVFPADLPVQACWALISNGTGAIPRFTLHRFTNDESQARSWPIDCREDARRHIEPGALQVQRAQGDTTALVDAWIVVDDDTRELLLSDPSFKAQPSAELPPV